MAVDIGELRGILGLQDNFSGPAENSVGALDGLTKAFGAAGVVAGAFAAGVGVAAAAVVGATAAIVELGMRGSDVNDVSDAFADLSERVGTTADVMLGALQRGTLGTVSNFELMKVSNGLLGTGIVKSAADMETLAGAAHLLADRTGGDTTEAFKTLTQAIETGRLGGLKALGIYGDSSAAVEKYAASLGVNVDALSEHGKAVGASQGILAALRAELEHAGPATRDFAEEVARGKAQMVNMKDSVASVVASSPAFVAAVKAWADGLAFASTFVKEHQQAIRNLISEGLIKVSQAFAYVLEGVSLFVEGFTKAKVVALDMGAALAVMALGFDFLQKVKDHPLDVAKAFEEMKQKTDLVKEALAITTKEAWDQADGFNGLIGKAILANAQFQELAKNTTAAATAAPPLVKAHKDIATTLDYETVLFDALTDAAARWAEKSQQMALAVAAKFTDLQNQMTLAHRTGIDQRLAAIEIERQKQLDDLPILPAAYQDVYDGLVTMVNEHYGQMTASALESFTQQAGASDLFNGRAIANAQAHLDAVKASNFAVRLDNDETNAAVLASDEQLAKAQKDVDAEVLKDKIEKGEMIAGAASSILRSIFGKSKAAAIAATIIDTIAAGVKVIAQLGWWGVIPAAAIVAQGYANVQKIRNQDAGFAMGTPDTAFLDFGRGTAAVLHHDEAVVTRKQGESVAGMVSDALAGAGQSDPAVLEQLRGLRGDFAALPKMIARAVRDAQLQAV